MPIPLAIKCEYCDNYEWDVVNPAPGLRGKWCYTCLDEALAEREVAWREDRQDW